MDKVQLEALLKENPAAMAAVQMANDRGKTSR